MSAVIYRAAELIVLAWVRLYLTGAPQQVRSHRIAEIASDLYEQRVDLHESGRSQVAASFSLLIRCTAGVFDDLSWRAVDAPAMGGTSVLRMMRYPGLVALVTVAILLVPLIAMQFTDEVDWESRTFAAAGVVLFGAGMTFRVILRRMTSAAYCVGFAVGLATAMTLARVDGATSILAEEDQHAVGMYLVVLATGAIGAFICRFHPRGMARTLFAAAAVQAVITVIATVAVFVDLSSLGALAEIDGAPPTLQLIGANSLFIALFLGSARLFQVAARSPAAIAHGA